MFSKLVKYIKPKIRGINISLNEIDYFSIKTKRKITRIVIEDPGIVTIDNIWE